MTFEPFDPLAFKSSKVNDAALGSLKREIENILSSYVGWYDPFCELIQNALDAVEARKVAEAQTGNGSYKPEVNIIIDLEENALTVTDNGIGLDKEKFEQFLAPNFSFKSGKTRGHKGVGATYVAYGFNYMRVSTKSPGFEASGRIVGARNWLRSGASGANPKVEPDTSALIDASFDAVDRGVSISVRFDEATHPKKLDWMKVRSAENWWKVLSVKTGLGSIVPNSDVAVTVAVKAKDGTTQFDKQGTGYLWLHGGAGKKASFKELVKTADDLYQKFGAGRALPDKFNKLDFIFETWGPEEILSLISGSLGEEEFEILEKHTPTVTMEFGYTAKLWQQFNEALGIRSGQRALSPGIQMAANNMPQGEVIQVPLNRNIGRQNQVHFLFHFDNYTPDLGRKGFHRELVDFAKTVSRAVMENQLSRYRTQLKANTGVAPDLAREMQISDWKKEMLSYEAADPLMLSSKHFFIPTERVSITSKPTREQDVIALFHQLIAGGVIRGLTIMATNERFTYDGLFKVAFDLEPVLYVYDADKNPLGVTTEVAHSLAGRITDPKILEYKFLLDGLIEDLDGQDKFLKDLDLCVVWETGGHYKERYGITSYLVPENSDQRQYHGVTHVLSDLETGSRHCDLIVLSELIDFLNDPAGQADVQRRKYE